MPTALACPTQIMPLCLLPYTGHDCQPNWATDIVNCPLELPENVGEMPENAWETSLASLGLTPGWYFKGVTFLLGQISLKFRKLPSIESLRLCAREVGSPCEWRGAVRHCSRVMVGESGLETCWIRSLEAFLGLRQDTLTSLDLCRWPQWASHGGSEKSGKLVVGRASRRNNIKFIMYLTEFYLVSLSSWKW